MNMRGMYRLVKSDPALIEAHARTQQAMMELERAIREAFEWCDRLADRLEGFDRRLQAARVTCHAESPSPRSPVSGRQGRRRRSPRRFDSSRAPSTTKRRGRVARPVGGTV